MAEECEIRKENSAIKNTIAVGKYYKSSKRGRKNKLIIPVAHRPTFKPVLPRAKAYCCLTQSLKTRLQELDEIVLLIALQIVGLLPILVHVKSGRL